MFFSFSDLGVVTICFFFFFGYFVFPLSFRFADLMFIFHLERDDSDSCISRLGVFLFVENSFLRDAALSSVLQLCSFHNVLHYLDDSLFNAAPASYKFAETRGSTSKASLL